MKYLRYIPYGFLLGVTLFVIKEGYAVWFQVHYYPW